MKYLFSVIIPVYNCETTIGPLIKAILRYSRNYSTEIVVIDSSSTDATPKIVRDFQNSHKNIKFLSIKKSEFNHGTTRNLGVRNSSGKYVLFLSDDVELKSPSIFDYFLEDFALSPQVVTVYGKQSPYPDTPLIGKVEALCRYERLDYFCNERGVLLQSLNRPFVPYIKKNRLLWYSLFDSFAAYKRAFLLARPFPRTKYGEDLLMGRKIIEAGLAKVYDKRAEVLHSHKFGVWDYFLRERQDVRHRIKRLGVSASPNLLCKIKRILKLKASLPKKCLYLGELAFYYFLKSLIFLELRLVN